MGVAGNAIHPGQSVVSRVSLILMSVADGSPTMTEIAARAGLPLSTVHRLVTELAAWGVLERSRTGRYRLGSLTGDAGERPADVDPRRCDGWGLRELAVPVMEDLMRATGMRVRVGFLHRTEVAYVEKRSPYEAVTPISAAARLPAHATALGKALLAFSPPPVVETLVARDLRRFTPYTLVEPHRLRRAFRMIRATRLAVCDRELEPDSCAVAVPVLTRDGVVAAVELDVRDLVADGAACKAPLSVAAGALSREVTRRSDAAAPVHRIRGG